jgi:hypothetical protein
VRPNGIHRGGRVRARLAATAVAIAVILVNATVLEVAAAPPPFAGPPPFVVHDQGGATAHILPTKTALAASRGLPASVPSLPANSTTPLLYHGGPVMRAPVNYAIFWQPAGTTAFPPAYISGIQRYFENIGGTPFYEILTQFGDTTGAPVPNAASFGGLWMDTNAFPGGHTGAVGSEVTNGDLQQAITDAIAANPSWQGPGLSTMYFVYLPQGIAQCFNATSCFAINSDPSYSDPDNDDYCAYHTYFNGDTIYASMPYTASSTFCGSAAVYPNGRDIDLVLSPTSHEMFEANTDPLLNAWYDTDGLSGENGDKCAYNYGYVAPNGVNLTLGGDPYQMQVEWSNNPTYGCVKRYGPNATVTLSGSLDFGTVPRGTTSTRTLTLQNGGSGDLNVLDIRLGSADPGFSLVSTTPQTTTLPAGASLPISVQFSPSPATTDGSSFTATLFVDTDDPTTAGGSPSPTYSAPVKAFVGIPRIALSPGSLNLGLVCRGSSAQASFSATDTGTAPLTISSASATPGGVGFSVLSPPTLPATIAVGGHLDFGVRFAPSGAAAGGPVSASVVVTSDAPSSPDSIALSGTVGVPTVSIGSSALSFGGVAVDDRTTPSTVDRTLTIGDSGPCGMNVTSLSISGANASDFTIVGAPSLPLAVAAGGSVPLTVRFDPSAPGARTASLAVGTDDPANPSVSVALSGTGLIPALAIAPSPIVFPPTVIIPQVPGNTGTVRTAQVANVGQATLIVDAMGASPTPPFSSPGASSPPARYAVNNGFSVPVTFAPMTVGNFTGSFSVADNDPEGPVSASVPLCGEGVQRGIRVLVVNSQGTPYPSVAKLHLQGKGAASSININLQDLPLVPVTTSCVAGEQRQYENQSLPSTGTTTQRSSYYSLAVSVGGKSATMTFTLTPTEFKTIVMTVK